MDTKSAEIIGNRYQIIDLLGRGAMGAIYRAFDRFNRETVALKQVSTTAGHSAFGSGHGIDTTVAEIRLTLAHEFETLASLHHPNVIGVKDYGFDSHGQPYFTMHLVENAETITRAARNRSVEGKIDLLSGALQALAYVHRRGIIHRDLKPENVLVTPDSAVKVVDFGLALIQEQREQAEEQTAGTLAYMAPEIILGDPASPQSDLYAIGMLAYELFAGHYPLDTSDLTALIQSIVGTPLDFSVLDVEYEIIYVLERLLRKSPEERYSDAYEVLVDLSTAIGRSAPRETVAIRESFLQAAQFVGREEQLGALTNALAGAMTGHGAAWLVGGESGVGKSRLIAELTTRALVRGVPVLVGQGVVDGGLPYQLWREPVRRLVLTANLSDRRASILKQIVPDIEQLLERPVPDPPELEGQAGQQRLLSTVTDLFRRHGQPLVLILEDLQWSVESLDVLRVLCPLTPDLPLLVIGSYRDDEKPSLPEELQDMQVMKLGRLDSESIAQLTVSMLGEAGRQPRILDLLTRETEGNVFFLVEVVRVLADEAGQLQDIGAMTLPEQVFAGGVQKIINRRLQRVPEAARAILNIAAVAGRQIDLDVMRAIQPDADLEDWLTTCANAAVLDTYDGQWRFAHEKLREAIVGTLPEQTLCQTHSQVAATLEVVYAEALDEYAATIGSHYRQADELINAIEWYIRAGKHAAATYAPGAAIGYYQQALSFLAETSSSGTWHLKQQIEACHGLGQMLSWEARYDEATEAYATMRQAAEQIGDEIAQSSAWHGQSITQVYQGDVRASMESAKRAEELARAHEGLDAQANVAKAMWMQGWNSLRLGDVAGALARGEEVVAIWKKLGRQRELAEAFNLMGAAHYTMGHYREAAEQFENGLALFQKVGDRSNTMALLNNLGWLSSAVGNYERAFTYYQEALTTARKIGNRNAEMVYQSNLGGARVGLGDYRGAEKDLLQVISAAEVTGLGELSETYRFLSEAYLGQGYPEEALSAALQSLRLGQEVEALEYIAGAWRVLGMAAAQLPKPVTLPGQTEDAPPRICRAADCFEESLRICKETGMEGELAQTLRAWALYEFGHGEHEKGTAMWQEARAIFERLGAEHEVVRMADMPQRST